MLGKCRASFSSLTAVSSFETARIATRSSFLNLLWTCSKSGNPSKHHPHQVAHRSITTTRPASDSRLAAPPARSVNEKSSDNFAKKSGGAAGPGMMNRLTSFAVAGISI